MFEKALSGDRRYWSWVGVLLVLMAAGTFFYLRQLDYGLGITGLSRASPSAVVGNTPSSPVNVAVTFLPLGFTSIGVTMYRF